jgi:hypothetical protein
VRWSFLTLCTCVKAAFHCCRAGAPQVCIDPELLGTLMISPPTFRPSVNSTHTVSPGDNWSAVCFSPSDSWSKSKSQSGRTVCPTKKKTFVPQNLGPTVSVTVVPTQFLVHPNCNTSSQVFLVHFWPT